MTSSSTSSPLPFLGFATIVSLTLVLQLHSLPVSAQPLDTAAAECTAQLLLLTPCMPFVQGLSTTPVDTCCDNLVNLYDRHPTCLCLILTQSSSFPINRTLALELPPLCNVTADPSHCNGISPSSNSQTMEGSNSTNSSAPGVAIGPRSGNLLFGMSSGGKQRVGEGTTFVLATAIVLFAMSFI